MDLEALERELRERRRATVRRLAALAGSFDNMVAASRDTNADDEHDPEGHTIAYERAQVAALAGQARTTLAEIDAALERIGDGTFARCEVCGDQIPSGRLRARPMARTCVRCARVPRR